ncbi:PREDICTED: uncharacterized protein LOC109114866 [Nelumbo nucifera]|uniref:Uncharacterized protein LOC109114866 n=2 Tax=Nelumbo nucifera TaxID=4432 RepID=A0A1U8Q4M9_NELNU|nr:PREDICTED: uncharacterized protein LOC109114866 [Nelumbo nucifera]DAD40146.1 TPA_asm: hypothetical protein HUJ06_014469 [Nelumbo nucifera]
MEQRSLISVCKLLSKYPFRRSPRPTYSFLPRSSAEILEGCLGDSIPLPETKIFSSPASKFHSFPRSIALNPSTQLRIRVGLRKFSGESASSADYSKEAGEINLKFAEAREEIEMALESKETVYFNEEADSARAAVKAVLDMFEGLMAKLPENEKGALQRSMGLKIEQLKAELEQLND